MHVSLRPEHNRRLSVVTSPKKKGRSEIAGQIAATVRYGVETYFDADSEIKRNESLQHAIVYRLTTDVIRAMSKLLEEWDEGEGHELPWSEIKRAAESYANETTVAWWPKRHAFVPNRSFEEDPEHVAWTLRSLEKDIPLPELQKEFERVRSATYRVMVTDDVPRIKESYQSALLTGEHLALLHSQGRESFNESTKEGVFVGPFDERMKGEGSSVEDELRDNLPKFPGDFTNEMEGRILEEGGKILAWMTYWKNRRPDRSANIARTEEYLRHGVTGGEMDYFAGPKLHDFLEQAPYILRFCDIRGEVPYAPSRLFAKGMQEVIHPVYGNPHLQSVMAYRLQELQLDPPIPGIYKGSTIPFAHNQKSRSFFSRRGFQDVATDGNPHGPVTRRTVKIPGREPFETSLNPIWAVMNNVVSGAAKKSASIWRSIQHNHGDLSDDSWKRSDME